MVRVPSGSMANTIIPGDHLVVKKRAIGEINRGDVIIFDFPKDPAIKYVSRVVGLPRESIEIRGKLVYIDGKEIPEQRVMVPNAAVEKLEELSSEGNGPYRVFYVYREGGAQAGVTSDLDSGDFGVNGA